MEPPPGGGISFGFPPKRRERRRQQKDAPPCLLPSDLDSRAFRVRSIDVSFDRGSPDGSRQTARQAVQWTDRSIARGAIQPPSSLLLGSPTTPQSIGRPSRILGASGSIDPLDPKSIDPSVGSIDGHGPCASSIGGRRQTPQLPAFQPKENLTAAQSINHTHTQPTTGKPRAGIDWIGSERRK